jgi:1,4-alpha-glucan branching enzyme
MLLFALSFSSGAQVVISEPAFPTVNDAVIITFDATQGSGGLEGYAGDVYAHTGVITDQSTSSTDWKYVQADWGVNIPKCLMTRIAPNLYQLNITPSVQAYYGVTGSEKILQMAFVFRSAAQVSGQWLEGKTETGGDIFVNVYEPGLNVSIVIPDKYAIIAVAFDTIPVQATAIGADTMALYVNDTLFKKVPGNTLTDSLFADNYGKYYVKVMASNDTGFVTDSFYYFVRQPVVISSLPASVTEGINYVDDSTVILCLYAPYKDYVFAVGEFSDWEVDASNYMYKIPDSSRYWIRLNHLIPSKEYIFQYFVDGELLIGDPYAEKVSDPWNDKYITADVYPGLIPYPESKTQGIATVFQTAQQSYQWETTGFTSPQISDLVIYELLVRDFTSTHSFQAIIDTLNYLKTLGVNAIELMPVMEFEGNISWGYNPSYYFAVDKYYGPKDKLKELIDICHSKGIAVIFDIVLNHSFGQSPMVMLYWDKQNNRPAANSPWFNPIPKHDYNVGYDMNHESVDTRRFVDRVVKFWLSEYQADGFRFDLSKGFTQKNTLGNTAEWGHLDTSRITILKRIADSIWQAKSDAFVILEHFADNDEEKILADYGMLLWGNENNPYTQSSMGWMNSSDFSWASYKARGWNEPHAVVYMESHDEERMMYKNITWGNSSDEYQIKDTATALQRTELAALFFFTIPGPKMMWQFEELGYDYSIEYNGRLGPKPVRWDYYGEWRRKYLHDVFAALIALKKEQKAFESSDFVLSLSGAMKRINITDVPMSMTILGNFGLTDGSTDPNFQHTGTWYEYFTRDSITVTDVQSPITLQHGEFRLYTDIKLAKPDLNTGIYDDHHPSSTADCRLLTVYPNPSTDGVNFEIRIEGTAKVRLEIYDLIGQRIKLLVNKNTITGNQNIYWNRRKDDNSKVDAGVYFYRLIINQKPESGKIIFAN